MHDPQAARRHILDRIALATQTIPAVMVEMPVLPGTLGEMQTILTELDRIGIFGINLLELCYPLINAEEFNAREFREASPVRDALRLLVCRWSAGFKRAGCLDLLDLAITRPEHGRTTARWRTSSWAESQQNTGVSRSPPPAAAISCSSQLKCSVTISHPRRAPEQRSRFPGRPAARLPGISREPDLRAEEARRRDRSYGRSNNAPTAWSSASSNLTTPRLFKPDL